MDSHGNEESDGTERHQLDQNIRKAEQGSSSRAHQLEAIFEAMTDTTKTGIFSG